MGNDQSVTSEEIHAERSNVFENIDEMSKHQVQQQRNTPNCDKVYMILAAKLIQIDNSMKKISKRNISFIFKNSSKSVTTLWVIAVNFAKCENV